MARALVCSLAVNPLAEGGASGPLAAAAAAEKARSSACVRQPAERNVGNRKWEAKGESSPREKAAEAAEEARLALTHFDGIPRMWVGHFAAAGREPRAAR